MRKIVLGAALLLLIAAAPTGARAQTTKVTYVAAGAISAARTLTAPAPVGKIAPLGGFSVVPSGTYITVMVEDVGSATGVPFSVCQANKSDAPAGGFCGDGADDISFGEQCAGPKARKFSGFKPRNPISIFVFTPTLSCTGYGTVGTATVVH